MYALRKINARDKCQALLDRAEAGKPRFSNARMSLITNVVRYMHFTASLYSFTRA